MTFLKDSKFFFTLYHAGKVNIILHVVSFSFLLHYHPTGIENSSCDPELKRVCGRLSSELV